MLLCYINIVLWFQFLIVNINKIIVSWIYLISVLSSAIINYNLHKMITIERAKDLVIILCYMSVEE